MESNAFAEFWRQLPPGKKVHPADKPILDKEKNSLRTRFLPAFGAGPLASAPVVLCYLNHALPDGPRKEEKEHGAAWGEYLAGIIEGTSEPRPLRSWGEKRTENLDPPAEARRGVGFVTSSHFFFASSMFLNFIITIITKVNCYKTLLLLKKRRQSNPLEPAIQLLPGKK